MSTHRALSDASRALIRQAGTRVEYARNKILFSEGDDSTHVLLIETGEVKVTCTSPTGYVFLLAHRGSGDLVGELGVASQVPRAATVATVGVVTAVSVQAERFRDLLQQHDVAMELIRLVSERTREGDRHRLELAAYPAFQRVVRALLGQSERQGSRTVVILQQDLAGAAGTSIESVARAVRELRLLGAISTRTGEIIISDVDLLRRLIGV